MEGIPALDPSRQDQIESVAHWRDEGLKVEFSERVQNLKPEGAYEVLERAQALESAGRNIIHLEIGQPDFPTVSAAKDSGIEAINSGCTRYTAPAGLPALRAAIAEHISGRSHTRIHPQQVIVTPGAKPNLLFPLLAIIEPGDTVLYPDPGFPSHRAVIEASGGRPVPYPLLESRAFSVDLDRVEYLMQEPPRAILLNSPSNPTGGLIPLQDLQVLAGWAVKRGVWVVSDEIYSHITYNGSPAPTILGLPGMAERTVLVDGFSKTFSMTGWRLGFGVMPEPLAERVALLITHGVGSTAEFTQIAGLAAVKTGWDEAERMRISFRRRRDYLVEELNGISSVRCVTPGGAFYAFPNISDFGISSRELAHQLLEQAGVALLPGTDFGAGGEGFLRISFAASMETLNEGVERLRAHFSRI